MLLCNSEKSVREVRILVLSKRRYMNKDLLSDRYGRFYEIPNMLVRKGHDVKGIALSYRKSEDSFCQWRKFSGCEWLALSAIPWGALRYASLVKKALGPWKPDLIWSASDSIHAGLGVWMKRTLGCPLVIDLYDNFESYGLNRIPGVTRLLRYACRVADGLTTVSQSLKCYAAENYRVSCPMAVIGNGVPEEVFYPRDRRQSRSMLGLPLDAMLVGTAGAIMSNRGIEDLFRAFLMLAEKKKNVWLVYAGPRDATPARYVHERVVDLGVLSYDRIPFLFSALDVGVICNQDASFGKYCFPQKFYEMLACRLPVVAAATGDLAGMLRDYPVHTYRPGNVQELHEHVDSLLERPSLPPIAVRSWEFEGQGLEKFLHTIDGS